MAVLDVVRRESVLVSADVAGWSRLLADDDLATIQAITTFRGVGEAVARDHGGRLVDSPGDNLLFAFATSQSALDAALSFQAQVHAANADVPAAQRMHFRIGVDRGEVVEQDRRVYGHGVNVAARLERLARPGGICLSQAVREALTDHPPLEDIGEQRVKNIQHPVRAWFVDVPGQVRTAVAAGGARPTVAVLPFDDLGEAPAQEYFADGLVEELLTSLAAARHFPVISRSSSFALRGSGYDTQQAGTALGARYVVVGSVRRAGDRVRITARLVDVDDGVQVWADRWDTAVADVFDAQAEVAEAIAVALRPELLRAESVRALRRAPADLDAWDYALRGLWHLHRPGAEDNARARELLQRAVDQDPSSGFAHGLLAHAHYLSLTHSWTDDVEATVAQLAVHADRAVECDPREAGGHLYRGLVASVAGRLGDAVASFRRAVELNPSLPVARSLLGQFLAVGGDHEAGAAEVEHAIRLSPEDPQLAALLSGLGVVHFHAGRLAEARAVCERALVVTPGFAPALTTVASTSALLGDLDRARTAARALERLAPRLTAETLRRVSASGRPEMVEQLLRGLELAGFRGATTVAAPAVTKETA
ncbi:tetratricopeptide repeat protein [Aquipuribacter sp. MA13-6]